MLTLLFSSALSSDDLADGNFVLERWQLCPPSTPQRRLLNPFVFFSKLESFIMEVLTTAVILLIQKTDPS